MIRQLYCYINNEGGIKCGYFNKRACSMWISAAHIPGIFSKKTNKQSNILDGSVKYDIEEECPAWWCTFIYTTFVSYMAHYS